MFVCKSSAVEPMPSRASALLQTAESLWERCLPAMNDNAVCLNNRSVCIAGKHRSHRGGGLSDVPRHRSSRASLAPTELRA